MSAPKKYKPILYSPPHRPSPGPYHAGGGFADKPRGVLSISEGRLEYAALWPFNVWEQADGLSAAAGIAALYWANGYSWNIFGSVEGFLYAYGISVGAVWIVDAAGLSNRFK